METNYFLDISKVWPDDRKYYNYIWKKEDLLFMVHADMMEGVYESEGEHPSGYFGIHVEHEIKKIIREDGFISGRSSFELT